MKKRTIIPIKENEKPHERIQRLRKEKGYTRETLADEIGYSSKTLQKIEQGKQDISSNALCQLADVLGVSTDYLLCRTNYTSINNEMISHEIGLSDASIENIKDVIKDDNRHNISALVLKACSNGAIRPPVKNSIKYLNDLLSSDCLINFLFALEMYLDTSYNIPIHYETEKKNQLPGWRPDNQYMFGDANGCNCIALAKNMPNLEDVNLDDFKPIPINDTFMETVALKDIDNILKLIKKDKLNN